jgi:hypothetical protein
MDWKKSLKTLKLEHIKRKSPGFFEASGGYSMKLKPYNDTTSNGLTKCIIDWIIYSGWDANRINTQGQVRKERIELAFGNYRDNITYTPSTTRKGTADIHAVVKGRHISIEVKIGRDKQSEYQSKEQQRVTNAGGIYYIAKDMQSFVDWWFNTLDETLQTK